MSVDEESPIKTLTIYETTRRNQEDIVDVDPHDETINRGPNQTEEIQYIFGNSYS